MKKLLILLLVITFTLSLLGEGSKTFKIGKYEWLTEDNTFEEVIALAKKAKKPVLAVFSATWCSPCKHVKKNVFKKDEFKEVADKVVLLYVEQTTKKGTEYNKRFNIKAFPTFKIFASDGIMLDSGHPERTVKGFSKWIDDVKGGNNFYTMSQKLKKDPDNRKLLMDITGKMGWGETKKKIEYLKRVIKLNPDYKNKLSKKAYEDLAYNMFIGYPYKGKPEEKENYKKNNDPFYEEIIKAYYPDKFEYSLKGDRGISLIMDWYGRTENSKMSVYYFEDFLKRKGKLLDPGKDMRIIVQGISGYINSGDMNSAKKWIDYSIEMVDKKPELKKVKYFLNFFSGITFSVTQGAKKLFEKKKIKEGKELIYSFYNNGKFWKHIPKNYLPNYYNSMAWAICEAGAADKKTLEIAKKAVELSENVNLMDTLATVHYQMGNVGKALEVEKKALEIAKSDKDKEDLKKNILKWEGELKKNKQ
ncbi:MAG: thioredoxin family protein [Acidobacteriota bacterium]